MCGNGSASRLRERHINKRTNNACKDETQESERKKKMFMKSKSMAPQRRKHSVMETMHIKVYEADGRIRCGPIT